MAEERPAREMTWEDHLAETIKAFRQEMKGWGGEMFPDEFHTHRRAAHREVLLAWRSLIDARIAKLDRADQDQAAPKATRIPVE